ncbi:MAG: DNA internalization-related competence protein ComEC/Rec2 [Bacillota bacterium]|jgi:competence protein ComEC
MAEDAGLVRECPPGGKGFNVPPLVLLTALYAGGCFAARYFPLPGSAALLAALFTILVAVIGYFYARQRTHRLIYFLFFILGIVGARFAVAEAACPLAGYADRYVTLSGTVVAEPDVRTQDVRYVLRVAEARVGKESFRGGKVLVVTREPEDVFGYGDLLRVKGFLYPPQAEGNPGEFDYAAYLSRRGIGVLVYARPEGITRLGHGVPNPLVVPALWLKGRLFTILDRVFPPEQSALVKGIAFGTRAAIDPAVNEAFIETGVVHILSVSGLHVGLVLGFVLGLARLVRLRPGATLLFAVLALLFYDLMVGADPPVVRATVMAVLLLWAKCLGRERDWPTALAVAALIILLANPLAVEDPGFQLSFAATWGILYLGPVLVDLLRRAGTRWGLAIKPALAWGLAVPLGAQLGTLPLVALHYGLVSPVALLANIVAVPMTGFILLFGILAAVFGLLFLPLGEILAAPAAFGLDLFLYLVRFFQSLPGAVLYVPAFPWTLVLLWYGLLYLLVRKATGKPLTPAGSASAGLGSWLARAAVFALVVLAWLGLFRWLDAGERTLRVDFIDVGQGDSALIRTPGGGTLLVDAGGWPGELAGELVDGAGMRVVRYLRREGVRRLDVLVLTHPHEDHCGGARAIVERIPVRLVVVPPLEPGVDDAFDRLLAFLREKGVPVSTAKAGDSIRLDPAVRIAVLAPFPPLGRDPAAFNDASLVLQASYKGKRFLFAGDVEEEGQHRLLQYGAELRSDVLKVPHHGSAKFLPAFFEAVRPGYAVISVGARNRFGQPAPVAIQKLERLGTRVYRTDRDGAVVFETDGAKFEIRTGRKAAKPAA